MHKVLDRLTDDSQYYLDCLRQGGIKGDDWYRACLYANEKTARSLGFKIVVNVSYEAVTGGEIA